MAFDALDCAFLMVTGNSATAVRSEAGTCTVTCSVADAGHGAAAGTGADVCPRSVVPNDAVAPFRISEPHKVNVNPGSPTLDRCVPDGLKMVTSVGVVEGETVM